MPCKYSNTTASTEEPNSKNEKEQSDLKKPPYLNWKGFSCIMLKQTCSTCFAALAMHMSKHWVSGISQTRGQTVDHGTLLERSTQNNNHFLAHHQMCILPVFSHAFPLDFPVYVDETKDMTKDPCRQRWLMTHDSALHHSKRYENLFHGLLGWMDYDILRYIKRYHSR